MDPPRSRDTKSAISVIQGFHEEVRPTPGVCESYYVAGPPNFRQLGPRDRVSDLRTSAKLGTPEAFSHLRLVNTSTLSDATVVILIERRDRSMASMNSKQFVATCLNGDGDVDFADDDDNDDNDVAVGIDVDVADRIAST
ncbi:unnamed protein product [Heligmosomoides polygyrus]|uniref:Uncharacterized protein n=1 Tax=Heligmosomoides polygyrus TaxID=6339 RepID=A0A3P7YUL9_HELPZ|nr:unnamed protein product [Heligmosomoides polygyrus]